ncbi:MAG TPA: hypothetical protein VJT31_18520 [Rugosimonospora sp.]|nr:hypothetical protein [Rugosimonospora sp.]
MMYDEQTRALADEVRAQHEPDDSGRCPRCRMAGCAAYRLAQRVRAAPITGPNVGVIEAAPIDGDRL